MRRSLSCALIALCSLSSAAFAEPGDAIRVTRLEGKSRDGKAIIHFEIDGEDWRGLQARGAWANLHVQAPTQTLETSQAFGLSEASTRLALDLGDPVPETLTVWLTTNDSNGGATDTMKIGGVATRSLELRLRPKREAAAAQPAAEPASWSANADVIAACGQSTQDPARCLAAAGRARFNPAAVIGACAQAVNTYPLIDQCIELAVKARDEPSLRLATCRSASNTYDAAIACFKSAVRARYEPSAAIQACRDAADTYELALSCVEVIADARADASGLVAACRQSIQTYDQLLGCVREGLPR